MAIIQLGRAFENFFAGRARYPRFRSKGMHDRSPSATTSSASTVAACASRNSGGCACGNRYASPVDDRPDAAVPHDRHRGSERTRDDVQSPPGAGGWRRGLTRVSPADRVQGGDAGWDGCGGKPLVPEQQDLLGMRGAARGAGVVGLALDVCGVRHDRDVNAAVNLKNHAVSYTVKACGEEGAGRSGIVPVKPASEKQEVSFQAV